VTVSTPNQQDVSRWRPEDVVVTRLIPVPVDALVGCLADPEVTSGNGAFAEFDWSDVGPLPTATTMSVWRARATLTRGRKRLRLPAVEINVVAWSNSLSEFRIIPLTQRANRWGVRRTRHYLEVANGAADSLASRFSTSISPTAPDPPGRHVTESTTAKLSIVGRRSGPAVPPFGCRRPANTAHDARPAPEDSPLPAVSRSPSRREGL